MSAEQCWPNLFVPDITGFRMYVVPFAPTPAAGRLGRCVSGRARVLCDMDPEPRDPGTCDCPSILEDAHPRIRLAGVRRMTVLNDPENLW